MIKRMYFISAQITSKDRKTVLAFKQFWWKSIFPEPEKILSYKWKEFADNYDVKTERVVITAFNRC